jgi:hypothetical protein
MPPRARQGAQRKGFAKADTVHINGRSEHLKLFVTPTCIKKKEPCFPSPGAGIQIEVKFEDRREANRAGIGKLRMVFSVDGDNSQEYHHLHDFPSSLSCRCPVVFEPPEAKTSTWVVRATFEDSSGFGSL